MINLPTGRQTSCTPSFLHFLLFLVLHSVRLVLAKEFFKFIIIILVSSAKELKLWQLFLSCLSRVPFKSYKEKSLHHLEILLLPDSAVNGKRKSQRAYWTSFPFRIFLPSGDCSISMLTCQIVKPLLGFIFMGSYVSHLPLCPTFVFVF